MADQNRLARTDLLQEILQGIGQGGDADGGERRRAAIARHVPGDRAKTVAESLNLAAPCPCRAADAMQEYQGRHAGSPAAS